MAYLLITLFAGDLLIELDVGFATPDCYNDHGIGKADGGSDIAPKKETICVDDSYVCWSSF